VQNPRVRTALLLVVAVLAVVAATAAVLFVWLRTYAPLNATRNASFAPGRGLSTSVRPTFGSGGKPVLFPAYRAARTFDTAFTIENTGRFAATVLGLASPAPGGGGLTAQAVFASDNPTVTADPAHLHPLTSLRLDPKDTATLDVRWRLDCSGQTGHFSSDRVRLRFRYLSLFTRTQAVELPFAVALRCAGAPSSP
jgi:hypothetical protein